MKYYHMPADRLFIRESETDNSAFMIYEHQGHIIVAKSQRVIESNITDYEITADRYIQALENATLSLKQSRDDMADHLRELTDDEVH